MQPPDAMRRGSSGEPRNTRRLVADFNGAFRRDSKVRLVALRLAVKFALNYEASEDAGSEIRRIEWRAPYAATYSGLAIW